MAEDNKGQPGQQPTPDPSDKQVDAADLTPAKPGEPTGAEKVEPGKPENPSLKTAGAEAPLSAAATTATPAGAKPGAPGATGTPSSAAAKPPSADKPAAPAKPAVPAKPAGPTPVPWDSEFVGRLKQQYGSGVREASTYLGQNYLVVEAGILQEILLNMRNDQRFDYCVDITAVHYPNREQQFELVYVLYSFPKNERMRIKTQIREGERPRSVVDIWETANWLEREVFDMFGIEFEGHPDLKRILLPDGWKGFPLRKEYPITLQDKEWVQINLGIESGQ